MKFLVKLWNLKKEGPSAPNKIAEFHKQMTLRATFSAIEKSAILIKGKRVLKKLEIRLKEKI